LNQPQKLICKKCFDQPNDDGCKCGGYGYVAALKLCPSCGESGYFRPGAMTLYEGKKYSSLDNLEMVAHLDRPDNCLKCEEAKSKN
jgi:hypothetical protein